MPPGQTVFLFLFIFYFPECFVGFFVDFDIVEEDEYNNKHIGGAINVPIDSISSAVSLSKDNPIIVYCETGNRSSQALEKLEALGYSNVYDLGSINNWEE